MFQPAFEVRVCKPTWTLCWAQLPIFTVFSCRFAISISSSLFKTSQFTFGPLIASWKKLASFNPKVEYFILWKRLSALGPLTLYARISQKGQTHSNNSSAICRRAVWVFGHFVELMLKGLTSIWHFCSMEFKLSSKIKKIMAMDWSDSIIQICNRVQFHIVSYICILFFQAKIIKLFHCLQTYTGIN